MSKVLKLVALVLVSVATTVGAASVSTMLGGLVYTFPSADGAAGQVLYNDGTGTLAWTDAAAGGSAVMPANLIVFSTGACPSGYSEYTALRGRYIVNTNASLGTTVGTALSNGENRATGNHSDHSLSSYVNISSGSHTHTVNDTGHTHNGDTGDAGLGRASEYVLVDSGPPEVWEWEPEATGRAAGTRNSGSSGTGISFGSATISASGSVDSFTIANGGTGTGTNAPYIQLMACYKTP